MFLHNVQVYGRDRCKTTAESVTTTIVRNINLIVGRAPPTIVGRAPRTDPRFSRVPMYIIFMTIVIISLSSTTRVVDKTAYGIAARVALTVFRFDDLQRRVD